MNRLPAAHTTFWFGNASRFDQGVARGSRLLQHKLFRHTPGSFAITHTNKAAATYPA